ncbi:hypothetical protein D041_0620B, partial [Vibrio parahaemolyticus EKP-008]
TPITIVNWLIATNFPRFSAGAISAIYIGDSADAKPIPTPPIIRYTTKALKLSDAAVPHADTTNRKAARIKGRLRPYLSEIVPAMKAPTIQPSSAELIAQPDNEALVMLKYAS